MRTRSRKPTSNQAPSSGRRSSLSIRAAASVLAQGHQLGPQVDHELHALRHADEFVQQADGGRLERLAQGARRLLGSAPALDDRHRRLARQAVIVGERQQELLAAGRRQRKVSLTEFGGTSAPRRLAALAGQAGGDAALETRNVVIGQIGAQRRAHDLARAAGGFDKGSRAGVRACGRRCWRREEPCADYVMASVSLQWRA